MSTQSFKITQEKEIVLGKDKLYISLINENKSYSVEVSNDMQRVVKLSTTKPDAIRIFNLLFERLSKYSDKSVAEFEAKRVLSPQYTIGQMLLLLKFEERFITSAEIGEFLRNKKYETKHGYLRGKRTRGAVTINVYMSSLHPKPFGRFFGTAMCDDFEFEIL